jgi:flavin reductase (DIM6/NTAB) family NADH-FMN oxidoreductase RutF
VVITRENITHWDQRYRATFINSLNGFKSPVLIGTKNTFGITNLAIFNSLFHLGANPPFFGLIVRPDSVERHTLSNILSENFFTVNHIPESIYRNAHQTSARYSSAQSEFTETGLTAEYIMDFPAPSVAECSVKIGARFVRKVDIVENGTILLISQIEWIDCPEDYISSDGFVDLEMGSHVTSCGLNSYHTTQKISRLTYAKPGILPRDLSIE